MKQVKNTYTLREDKLTNDEIRNSLESFEFYSEHCVQIVDKQRKTVPFILNGAQRKLADTLLPLIRKETRLNKRLTVIIPKSRQQGISTFSIEFLNYISAYLQDLENTSICYTLPVTDTVSKFYTKKVEPMISGVHPDLFANIEKETLGSSIILKYNDIKGIRRNNYLEIVSSNASSIRSDTVHILVEDEVCSYTKPDILQDAVMPSLPDDGFSLVIYLSTFDDRKNDFFLKQMQIAIDNPEDYNLVFLPWYLLYPEQKVGIPMDSLELTEYDRNVIIPALINDEIPGEYWGDCINWYHKRKLTVSNMVKEFPTTIEELLTFSEEKKVFSQESIDAQKQNILAGKKMRIMTDNLTGKPTAVESDASPFTIYQDPLYGHNYKLVVDPITAVNDESDYFAMAVFDDQTLEQVAVFNGKDMMLEDYADYAVAIAKLYNNAIIVPESNVAAAFVTSVYSMRYYNFYYESTIARKNRTPGIRTTATSKENMIDNLKLLLDNNRLTIHDSDTIEQLSFYEKKIKTRADGSQSVKMMARKGKHDDLVSVLFIFVGSLNQSQLAGNKKRTFSVL